jgi:hypothetical protein
MGNKMDKRQGTGFGRRKLGVPPCKSVSLVQNKALIDTFGDQLSLSHTGNNGS